MGLGVRFEVGVLGLGVRFEVGLGGLAAWGWVCGLRFGLGFY